MTIHIEGIEPLLSKLTTLAQLKQLAKAVKAAAIHVRGKAARYPAESHRPQPFKTDKQRRGFFAKLRSGEIEVPYRRGISPGSETLGRKWTIAGSNAGLTQTIGNNASYAKLVQSDEDQTGYHRATGWQTVTQIVDNERETVIQYIQEEIERIVA